MALSLPLMTALPARAQAEAETVQVEASQTETKLVSGGHPKSLTGKMAGQ